MNKKLLLFSIAVLIILSLNSVSGFYHYPKNHINDFKETTEFKQTTEHRVGDFWNFESTKRTITEETEVRRRTRTPIYYSYRHPHSNSYKDQVPSSNWRFKEPYDHKKYANAPNNDYYYKPRYNHDSGTYNWRW